MKTDVYIAYDQEKFITTVNYGVGDIVKVNDYGEVYPSYQGAYDVFGFDINKKNQFEGANEEQRINIYRVVGFLLHDQATAIFRSRDCEVNNILVAITNGNEDLIVNSVAIEPIAYYNKVTSNKRDSVAISAVHDAANYCASAKMCTSQDS